MSAKTVENLKKVLAVNAKINSTLNLDELLGIIMNVAKEVMCTEASSLMLKDENTGELVFRVALGEKGCQLLEKFRIKMGEGIAGSVAAHGKPEIVNDPQNDPRFARRFDQATGFSTKAVLCVPVRIRGQVAGVLQAINPIDRAAFDEDDLELFETFSEQAAISLENARIHSELIRREKTKQELKIAQEIQQNFLPELTDTLSPADIAAESLPALELGGDFYDVIALPHNRTGIVIGDVSGKGVPAALYMVRVISECRFLAPRCKGPADLLTKLNNSLSAKTQRGMFVTLFYLELDHSKSLLRYGVAGHNPLFHRSPEGTVSTLGEAGGLPLGLIEDSSYGEDATAFKKDDFFLLYTDGVTEARNKQSEEFGTSRVQDFLKTPLRPAKETVRNLLQELQNFTRDMPRHDDTTLVAVRIR